MSSTLPETEANTKGKISRRDFLKYVGATGAIFGLFSLPFIKTILARVNGTNLQISLPS